MRGLPFADLMLSVLALGLGLFAGVALGWVAASARRAGRGTATVVQVAELETALQYERAATQEKVQLLETARERLETTMKAVASDALRASNASFLELAKTQLDQKEKAVAHLVDPIRESLAKVDQELKALEAKRTHAYVTLTEQVQQLGLSQKELRLETGKLVTALRAPQVRGRWGEIQLRRVVEIAGMVAHCDFYEQQTTTTDEGQRFRPDMVVRLAGGRQIVVDAKVPIEAYLNAREALDDETRAARLADHARQVRDHVNKLASKTYWTEVTQTPEFAILFIPGEVFFSAALEQDPELLEFGARKGVILATPTTLIALLHAAAYGWQEERVAEGARAVSALGRELYDRMATLVTHFTKVGKSLDSSVRAYNDAVGSLESRVLPSARKLKEHGIGGSSELGELTQLERTVRTLTAPELPELAAAPDAPASRDAA
jgi:DNA recombination protein RmuC